MKKSILEIYALLTCFVAVIFLIVSLSEGLYNFIGVINPDLTISSYRYAQLQTNERYRKKCCRKDSKPKSEDDTTKLRMEAYDLELRMEARANLQHLLKNIIYIILSGIVLFIHWKIAKAAREQ